MIEVVTAISLWELVKHAGSWVVNLQRARRSRKEESVDALRKVVIAARHTAVYMRQLQDTGQRSHQKEDELATLWTELSFALEDLGMDKLAKRCRIKGKEWAAPQSMDETYLDKADAGLERMEQLANALLQELRD